MEKAKLMGTRFGKFNYDDIEIHDRTEVNYDDVEIYDRIDVNNV